MIFFNKIPNVLQEKGTFTKKAFLNKFGNLHKKTF